MFVFYVRILCMYSMYVFYVCILCMHSMHVFYACILCMYSTYAFRIFVCKASWLSRPPGAKINEKTAPANPRRSLFEKCFKSWFDIVRWWEMSCAFDFFRNYWFRCFLRRVMVIFRQQKNFCPNVTYCVLDIMKMVRCWRVSHRTSTSPTTTSLRELLF